MSGPVCGPLDTDGGTEGLGGREGGIGGGLGPDVGYGGERPLEVGVSGDSFWRGGRWGEGGGDRWRKGGSVDGRAQY